MALNNIHAPRQAKVALSPHTVKIFDAELYPQVHYEYYLQLLFFPLVVTAMSVIG